MYTSKLSQWFKENNMNRIFKLLMVVAMALTIFGAHGTVSAGGGAEFRFQGESAIANFSSTDESGCIVTDVYLWGSDAVMTSTPGQSSPNSSAYVLIDRYDECSETQLFRADGWTELSDSDFQVAKKYASARLNTPITVYDDESGDSFEVQLDLIWTADGPLSRQKTHTTSNTPGCVINARRNGSIRHAQVSGTVSDGVTNYTPAPAQYGEIGSLKSGTVVIGCE
jgi:hypothetical protein